MISTIVLIYGFTLLAQVSELKTGLTFERPPVKHSTELHQEQAIFPGELLLVVPSKHFKNTDALSIINIGTSANAYSYGWGGGQRSLLCAHDELGLVCNFHRMGGALDPNGYSGDMGFDFSIDWGQSWSVMNECYMVSDGWGIYYESARYPQHGIFNPPGNTNPDSAYVVFFAPVLDGSNQQDGWGGYCFGCAPVGDPTDTTKNLISSNPQAGYYQYLPDGFTVTSTGNFWVVDYNIKYLPYPDDGHWQQELLISHGTWNETAKDFDLEQFLLPCPTLDTTAVPQCARVEFSPDGQFGYIVALADNGNVAISAGQSLYPILWRTEDYGQTWTGPIEVALAGENGISGVQDFLTVDQLEELFEPPIPNPDEVPFTTAYDFDLSVDADGNPNIAVVVGVTGGEPYAIITEKSMESDYLFMASFILRSDDKGNPGSWHGRELGNLVSFRGEYGDLYEYNRIQIARDAVGEKMFVAWLDTDTTVSASNNAPDIWACGYDISSNSLTYNYETGDDDPQNITFGSEATFGAHFFAMSNQVIYNDDLSTPVYILPMVYEDMTPTDPSQPVQYKYIQNAFFWEAQFAVGAPYPGIEEFDKIIAEVSEVFPNPAKTSATFNILLKKQAATNIQITNLVGQNVKAFQRNLNVGNNEIMLDISDLKSGIYFITIEAGGQTLTKKMMVE